MEQYIWNIFSVIIWYLIWYANTNLGYTMWRTSTSINIYFNKRWTNTLKLIICSYLVNENNLTTRIFCLFCVVIWLSVSILELWEGLRPFPCQRLWFKQKHKFLLLNWRHWRKKQFIFYTICPDTRNMSKIARVCGHWSLEKSRFASKLKNCFPSEKCPKHMLQFFNINLCRKRFQNEI